MNEQYAEQPLLDAGWLLTVSYEPGGRVYVLWWHEHYGEASSENMERDECKARAEAAIAAYKAKRGEA